MSSVSRYAPTDAQVMTWRKSLGLYDYVVVSGIDNSAGQPAYRLLVTIDTLNGVSGMRMPSDQESREILEDFGLLDAREQDCQHSGGIARGFVKWAHSEARA